MIESLHPGTSVVIIGLPQADASIKDFGKPSLYDVRTAMFEYLYSLEISFLKPKNFTFESSLIFSISFEVSDEGFDKSILPTNQNLALIFLQILY